MGKSISFAFLLLAVFAVFPAFAAFRQQQKITATQPGSGAQFGYAVAIDRSYMIVGAPFDSTVANEAGAAYVFTQWSDGTWHQLAALRANDGRAGDHFGSSVAIAGAYWVIGADHADAPLVDSGAAYLFTRCGSSCWIQGPKFLANDSAAGDLFGSSVAISFTVSGVNHIVIGAKNADAGAGAAYRFLGGTPVQRLSSSPVVLGDHFGDSIAISGNRLVVGASGDNTPEIGAGAAYVFTDNGTSYNLEQKLTIPDGTSGDQFGSSVAIDVGTIVVGAKEDYTVVGQTGVGAAYIFSFTGTNWTQQKKLLASDGLGLDHFGYSVAVKGDTVAVGALGDDTAAGADSGSAYIYRGSAANWLEIHKLLPSDTSNGDRFGGSMAFTGNGSLVIGAAEKAVINPAQGSLYLFKPISYSTSFDYDNDDKADISVFRPSNSAWYLSQSTAGPYGTLFGLPTDKIVPSDYDGDRKTDIAVYRPSTGIWYILNSANATVSYYYFGLAEDLPTPADYDGDGKADISVFRPSNGIWYRIYSSIGSLYGNQIGVFGDKPTIGDFDGDGKSDMAVFRPSTGAWYRINNSDNSIHGEFFGLESDVVTPADYDGDGKTDLAVFRPSTGTWYIKNSSDSSYTYHVFGLGTDIPAPADFDGDGKADICVFRPLDGNWYRQNSSNGAFIAFQFGTNGDRPTMTTFRY